LNAAAKHSTVVLFQKNLIGKAIYELIFILLTSEVNYHQKSISKMAKWGEGDARWQVKDLGDSGKNVNGWHWTEFNALPWSTDRLKELLCSMILVEDKDGAVIKITKEDIKLTGECVINQRKGKIIPAYELDLSLKWKGTDADDAEGSGDIKVPYISEENHDEDPEVQISVKTGDGPAEKMRTLIVHHGRPKIYKAIRTFVKELSVGGPLKPGSESAAAAAAAAAGSTDKAKEKTPSVAEIKAAAPTTAPTAARKNGTSRSIEITENYYASCKDLYECFTDTNRVRAYTASVAEINATPGGSFSMFGGSIEGTFRELIPYSSIAMDWRFSSWPDGATSRVVISFEEREKGSVMLQLKQTGIPESDRYGNHDVLNMTQAGWKQQVLLRIRQVFGFGA
jgi:activator of HSP90 ATPase